jgi:Ribbon-helix-helix protein, copG family
MLNRSMAKSKNIVKRKKRGRPIEVGAGATKFVGVRLPAALLRRVDDRAKREGVGRSEAFRDLIERGLGTK